MSERNNIFLRMKTIWQLEFSYTYMKEIATKNKEKEFYNENTRENVQCVRFQK